MRFATYRITAHGLDSRDARAGIQSSSVRFGDELLVYAPDSEWQSISVRAGASGLVLQEQAGEFEKEELHLVVQVGDSFRQQHPRVPVLLNKGRYLAVSLKPEQARRLAAKKSCCYTIHPLEAGEVVFELQPPPAERAQPEAWLKTLVSRLSRPHVEATLQHLVSFPTRHSTSTHYLAAAVWARAQLAAMGYNTRLQTVKLDGGKSLNVIAEKAGQSSGARGLVVVTAHLDSINREGDAAPAPGADDNGSSAAGLLEIARVLKEHAGAHDLRFVLFGGEEQGLHGSDQHVAALTTNERARIRAVVNMDMIATLNTTQPTVLLEGAPVSRSVIEGLAAAAAAHTKLFVQTSLKAADSDHVSFIRAGIPAVLTIEGADRTNQNVHTEHDTLLHINYDLLLEILRMNVAFVATAVGRQGGIPMFDSHTPTQDENRLDAAFAEEQRAPAFQFSGCYKYNGGASSREGRSFTDHASGQSMAAIENPIYRLDEPVYLDSPEEYDEAERAPDQLRFTISVDIDGSDPLNIVSGTVALGPDTPGVASPHFIGRVASNTAAGTGRILTVRDFEFRWPNSNDSINQITVELTRASPANPSAKLTFSDTVLNHHHGPYAVARSSPYFHEVEMDIDREMNAVDVEPYDTHTHPDRPSNLPRESLTLESAFAKAGIRITRSQGSGTVVNTSSAGTDRRWSYSELHDSMQLHWDAFANKPQWKMWLFLAELAESDSLGGVMFDGEINEPGGVDRQGTAIFTKCPFFHTPGGGYISANPPVDEAVKRELFFNLMHETGHAFNLAHSFQKEQGGVWRPPAWMPIKTDNQSLSWMNYPDQATPVPGPTPNATWFYRRFRFRFDRSELLFLRHAPETYVEMGAQAWFKNHGRVARINLDPRLELIVRSRQTVTHVGRAVTFFELGEPVILELRLRNVSSQPITAHANLDPSDGLVEVAVTNPRGERWPFLPIDHTRTLMQLLTLEPGGQSVYGQLDLTMGSFGFPFKEPGAYRVEVSYTNVDGSTAAAVMQLYVRPPAQYDAVPIVNELFDARVGRTLYVDGTRVMEDVNDKLGWVGQRLRDVLGERNPISMHLSVVQCKPLATDGKYIDPDTSELRAGGEEPDRVVA
ncbi:MAG TPA: M28 family metallopeptidase, partial [Pyrinomonadaceae bacterium]